MDSRQESLKGSNAWSISVRIREALFCAELTHLLKMADGLSQVRNLLEVKLLAWCLIGFSLNDLIVEDVTEISCCRYVK